MTFLIAMILKATFIMLAQCIIISYQFNLNQKNIFLNNNENDRFEFIICREFIFDSGNQNNFGIESPISIITNFTECRNVIPQRSFEKQTELFVFFIYPKDLISFYFSISQVQATLAGYSNKNHFQQPIYIIYCPHVFTSDNKVYETTIIQNKLRRIVSLSYCFPITSLIFISLPKFTNSDKSKFWEIYCSDKTNVNIIDVTNLFLINNTFILSEVIRIVSRRQNFHGINLKVLGKTNVGNQADTKLETINGTTKFISGLSVHVLRDLQFLLNFTVTAIEGNEFMREASDGSITGVGKPVVDGEVDLSIALSNLIPYRLRWLNFLQPIMRDRLTTFFIQPPNSAFRNLIVLPFSFKLWLTLAFVWLIIICSSILILKYLSKKDDILSTTDMIMWCIGAMCLQGFHKNPKTLPMQIIFLVGFVTSVITVIAYSSSIVSLLSRIEKPVKNFNDLIYYNYRILGNSSLHYFHELLKDQNKASELESQSLKDYINTNESIKTLLSLNPRLPLPGVTEILNEFYYFARALNYSEKKLCHVEFFPANKQSTKVAMFVKKGSPLKEFFNSKTILILQSGLLNRYKKKYFLEILPSCSTEVIHVSYSLRIQDCISTYLILIFGLLISFVCFLFEVISLRTMVS